MVNEIFLFFKSFLMSHNWFRKFLLCFPSFVLSLFLYLCFIFGILFILLHILKILEVVSSVFFSTEEQLWWDLVHNCAKETPNIRSGSPFISVLCAGISFWDSDCGHFQGSLHLFSSSQGLWALLCPVFENCCFKYFVCSLVSGVDKQVYSCYPIIA